MTETVCDKEKDIKSVQKCMEMCQKCMEIWENCDPRRKPRALKNTTPGKIGRVGKGAIV